MRFVVVGDIDIQVYSSKEKASVIVNGEVVSNFLNGVRCLHAI